MFSFTVPTNVKKINTLAGKVTTRYLDMQLAKEEAKQLDHTLSIEHHADDRKVARAERKAKHTASLADRLKNLSTTEEGDVQLVEAFLALEETA